MQAQLPRTIVPERQPKGTQHDVTKHITAEASRSDGESRDRSVQYFADVCAIPRMIASVNARQHHLDIHLSATLSFSNDVNELAYHPAITGVSMPFQSFQVGISVSLRNN